MALQHLRSSTAHKRPIPTVMSAGQIAINTNEASPALFFKDSNGDLVKVGPVHIGENAPNSSPASVAATALVTGTVYQILTVGTTDFTLVGAVSNTVGAVFTATGTTTGTGTVSGQQGVEKGEMWLDTTGGTYVLKIYDGSAWRSESGTFVDSAGDTMTGALLLDNAASASAPDLSFDGDANTGIYSPGADKVAIATGGNGRVFIDSSGRLLVGTSSSSGPALLCVQGQQGNSSAGAGISIRRGEVATSIASGEGIGNIYFEDNAGSRFASIFCQADANSGLGDHPGRLMFSTTADGESSPTERMRIDSSGHVGIGLEPSDDSKLQVNGSMRFAGSGTATDSVNPVIYRVPNEDSLAFASGNSERMRIDSSGRVGVGTTNPTANLHIVPTALDTDIFAIRRNDSSTAKLFRIFQDSSMPGGEGGAHINTANRSLAITATASAGTSDGIYLKTTGDVGIGTASPQNNLHVNTSGTSTRIQLTNSTTGQGSGDGTAFFQHGSTFFINNRENDDIYFATNNNERVRIDSSGNVGIGTDSPSSYGGAVKLALSSTGNTAFSIASGTSSAGTLFFADGESGDATYRGSVKYAHSDDSMQFSTAANERMRIDSSGNVGVGTSSPGVLLDAVGSNPTLRVRASTINTETSTLRLTEDNSYVGAFVKYDGSTNLTHIGTHSAADSNIANDNNAITIVRDTRHIGIGTSNPNALLHLESASSASLRIKNTANNSPSAPHLELLNDNNKGLDIKVNRSGSDSRAKFIADTAITVETNGSERVRIDSSGRLGVGTSSPQQVLHLASSAATTLLQFNDSGSGGTAAQVRIGSAGNDFVVLNNTASNTATERLRITSAGNVGIGTSSPAGALHVDANSGVDGPVFDSGGTANANHALLVRDSANNQLLRVNNNGNIGIGDTSPDARLTVYRQTQFANNAVFTVKSDAGDTKSTIFKIDGDGAAEFTSSVNIGSRDTDSASGSGHRLFTNSTYSALFTQASSSASNGTVVYRVDKGTDIEKIKFTADGSASLLVK